MNEPTASTGNAGLAQQPSTAFESEILSQPDALRDAITTNLEPIRAATALVAGARRIRLTGAGAEYYAAAAGAWMLRDVGVTSITSRSYDLANYPTGFEPGDLLIVLSHRPPDQNITSTLRRARSSGLSSVAITSAGTAIDADAVIETSSPERSSTPSHSVMIPLAVLAAIAARFEPRSMLASAVPTLPETVRGMMRSRDIAGQVASAIESGNRQIAIAGQAQMFRAAELGALTVEMATRRNIRSVHNDDVLLGYPLPRNEGDVLIQLAPDGAGNDINSQLRQAAASWNLRRWKIGSQVDDAEWFSRLPDVPEVITPIHTLVPLQWLALELASLLGEDPDKPAAGEAQLATATS